MDDGLPAGANFIILLVVAVVVGILWNGGVKMFYIYCK